MKYQAEKLRNVMATHIPSGRSPRGFSSLASFLGNTSVEIPRLNVLKSGACDPTETGLLANTKNEPEGPGLVVKGGLQEMA